MNELSDSLQEGDEISLLDIINFLLDSWKKLALRSQLLLIQVLFTKGLEGSNAPTANKKGMIKSAQVAWPQLFPDAISTLRSKSLDQYQEWWCSVMFQAKVVARDRALAGLCVK